MWHWHVLHCCACSKEEEELAAKYPADSLLIGDLVAVRVCENSKAINMMIVVVNPQLHASWLLLMMCIVVVRTTKARATGSS